MYSLGSIEPQWWHRISIILLPHAFAELHNIFRNHDIHDLPNQPNEDNVSFFFLQLPLNYKVVEIFIRFNNIKSTKTFKAHSLCCDFSTLKAKSHDCAIQTPLIGFLNPPEREVWFCFEVSL